MNPLASFVEMIIHALSQQDAPDELKPFEPDERVLWAVRRGARTALGEQGAAGLIAALPDATDKADCAKFLAGSAVGAGEAVVDVVTEQLEAITTVIKGLISYYSVVYDLALWRELLAVWIAPRGSSVEPFARFLQAAHPDLYAALVNYAPLCEQLNVLVQPLRDASPAAGSPWHVNEQAVADWLSAVPLWLGRQVRTVTDELLAAKGDPFAQGKTVGRVGARAAIEAALLALDVHDLAAAGARGAERLVSEARLVLGSAERSNVLARVGSAAPKLQEAAAGVARAKSVAVTIYEDLATKIAPHDVLKMETMAFNREIRTTLGYSVSDVEYVSLRLDSNHIVKDSLHSRFPGEFDRLFGWKTPGRMDAKALHTEWHIRSGERLRTDLDLRGAENERSFSKMLDGHVEEWEQKHGAFRNVEEIFLVHEDFYREYSPQLYVQLSLWFAEKLARIREEK